MTADPAFPPHQFELHYLRLPDRRYRFNSSLVEAGSNHIVLAHSLTPSRPVYADGNVVIEAGDLAVWFLFREKPYDVARVHDAWGQFRGYYVDALEPVRWRGSDPTTLEPLVDLFVDLWIWPDLRFEILDEDELEEAEVNRWIAPSQSTLARKTIHALVDEIEAATFPPPLVRKYDLSGPGLLALTEQTKRTA